MAIILDINYGKVNPASNHREPLIGWAEGPPQVGQWLAGDIIYKVTPAVSSTTGWICLTAGNPGLWTTLPETVS